MLEERVAKTTDVCKGDSVKVRLLALMIGKVKLSMKRVDQKTGAISKLFLSLKNDVVNQRSKKRVGKNWDS